MNTDSYFVYALRSEKTNQYYIGISNDVERRIREHNRGKTRSTSRYSPWVLIYVEICENRIIARKREKYLKSGYGKEQLKLFVQKFPVESLTCFHTFKSQDHIPVPLCISP